MKPDAIEIAVAPDLTLRGQLWPGDGVFVLLFHDPGEDRDLDLWRPLIPYLLGAGVTVIALDLRGHGASDGDWEPSRSVDDLVAVMTEVRRREAFRIVVCAAGESANSALRAAEMTSMDGLVLLSPSAPHDPVPRGAGEPKLVISSFNSEARTQIDNLRSSVIGSTLFVTVPGKDSGSGLFAGEVAITCREQFLAFLRKVRTDGQGAPAPDRFLELLGIHGKGKRT
jgi:pimeloyl-ACP methyl ester carboxylesterase